MLKSMARCVKSHPRVLLQCKYQEPPLSMDAIVDTDFPRCTRTGKSTNGGTQLTKSWPARRPLRDVQWRGGVLRRREGSVRGRGYVVSLLQDVTRRNNVLVSTDSSAARGIAMRWSVVKVTAP